LNAYSSHTSSPKRRGRHSYPLLATALALAALLAACQTPGPVVQVPVTEEALAITVNPYNNDSPDLEGQTVSGTIVISIPAEGWMKQVRFYLNGRLRETLSSPPFELAVDTTSLADGPHSIGIEALMANGRIRVSQLVHFVVANDGIEPISGGPTEPGDSMEPPAGAATSFRGDTSFARNQLSSAQRPLYDRILLEINDSTSRSAILGDASSDDIYTYAREFYSHIQSVLTVFRLTGDLALLDYVDTLAELMRAELRDGWRGTVDGTDGTTDGYLNWVDRRASSDAHRGKDTWRANEMGTHALVATIAYALQANRDLTSPTGRNYGAHADFWKDYLVNHFEAKWRTRENVKTGFPIMTVPHTTTHYKWIAYHYYMGRLTGNTAYTAEANRMADLQWAEHFTINTPAGPSYVWARSLKSLGGSESSLLHPTTYARHVYGLSVDFHLEGFHNWASTETMIRFARTFTEAIIDTEDPIQNGMAADIGGEVAVLHLQPNSYSRLSLSRYRDSNYGLISAWDATGKIRSITDTVQDMFESHDTTRLAAALFIDTWLKPRTDIQPRPMERERPPGSSRR
jgi:hypothetical protein